MMLNDLVIYSKLRKIKALLIFLKDEFFKNALV
jgi:hypothetical protein